MKKLVILLCLVVCAGSVVAQNTKREAREAKQQKVQSEYNSSLVEAIKSSAFTFTAENMSQNFGENYPITGPYTTLYLSPNYLRVQLPYLTSSQSPATTPLSIDFTTETVKYSFSERKGMYYVKIVATNVVNNQANNKVQNGSYTFSFEISPITGNTFLTVTPSFNASITYTGIIAPNN